MAIKFKEVRASKIYTDGIYTAAGEPANTGAHAITGNSSVTGTFGVTSNVTVGGTLGVTGNSTLGGTLDVTGAATVGGTLAITGATTFTGAIAADGGITVDTDKFVVADTTGATTIKAPLTVGVNDTGHDVKFFGATAGKYMLWDESADTLDVVGTTRTLGALQMTGVTADGVTVLFGNSGGDAVVAMGATVPVDTTAGYIKGCLFIQTDGTDHTNTLYVNIGTDASCNFNAATIAAD